MRAESNYHSLCLILAASEHSRLKSSHRRNAFVLNETRIDVGIVSSSPIRLLVILSFPNLSHLYGLDANVD